MIDFTPLPVAFQLERFGCVSIDFQEWMRLRKRAIEFVVGKGFQTMKFTVLHTNAGFADLVSHTKIKWMADDFEIIRAVADEKQRHFLEISHNDVIHRLSFESLLPDKICATLFNIGIAVDRTSGAHEAFSMYLQAAAAELQVEDAMQVLGWHCNNTLQWYGANHTPPALQAHLELSPEDYLAELNRLIVSSPALQFVLCAAAASTLMAYLKITEKIPVDCFAVSLVGTSSTGKTTALKLAASLYSSPEDENVFTAFYGTANALNRMLGKHHGVPIAYDESTIRNSIRISDFIYAFTQGREKLRLDSNAQLKYRNSWECTALFSSETYLVNAEQDNLGIIARVITLDGLTYTKDSTHSEQIKTFAGKNYGYVGSALADYLLSADSAEILQKFQAMREELLNAFSETCNLTNRLVMHYAMILTTSLLLHTLGIQMDMGVLKQMCVILHGDIVKESHPGKNLVIRIFNYICSNYKRIDGVNWTLDREKKPLKVEILESTFEEILSRIGDTDKKTAVRNLLNEGFLAAPEKNRIKAKISIDGVVSYGYRFQYQKVDEAFGSVNDEVYTYKKQQSFGLMREMEEREAVYGRGYKLTDQSGAVKGRLLLL
ncbi:DUF927 domain-containing protein [Ruminococcus sp.]|uniref:DUF927 domain-containing protein n=1 Tax=Ruminococcus sp. TaxID=41978 RepID=UPI0025ECFDF4|nr:DUF927 domain-containing protein [Ruminococcus sp.]